MIQDNISDLIIRLKNAGDAGKQTAVVPHTKMNMKIVELLEKKGYIASSKQKGKDVGALIEVMLLEGIAEKPYIKGVKRHSKSSKRVYLGADKIYPVRNGYGMLVVSTSKGIMSGDDARKANIGGEILFEIH